MSAMKETVIRDSVWNPRHVNWRTGQGQEWGRVPYVPLMARTLATRSWKP